MYITNTNNERVMEAVRFLLNSRSLKNLSTECIMEGTKICLLNNNSCFANIHLLQTNGTATGAQNSCSYFDIGTTHLDNIIRGRSRGSSPRSTSDY